MSKVPPTISEIRRVIAVHTLTASGAVIALIALLTAVSSDDWRITFWWLGLALVVDTIDGPLSRAVHAKTVLPRFSGERLDLIVDYITFVFVPVVIALQTKLYQPWLALPMAALILLTSLHHFADTASKSYDHNFIGFPALWNGVIFMFLALELTPLWCTLITIALGIATLFPIHWPHPNRSPIHKPLPLVAACIWGLGAALVLTKFTVIGNVLLIVTSLYFGVICVIATRQAHRRFR